MTRRRSLQTAAYDHLKRMIYSAELQFGVIYSETKLAGQLAISRTPIRDALNRLAHERYIDILPNRGFQLHLPNATDLREAYHARLMIEGYCVALLTRDHELPAAQAAIEKMRRADEAQRELIERNTIEETGDFWEADRAFHGAALEYLNISAFNMQYDTFLHFFMPHSLGREEMLARRRSTLVEHGEILNAVARGDETAAGQAVRAHLDSSLETSMAAL